MTSLACCAPAALAGDDLVAACSARAYEQRLDDALSAHRLGESGAGLAVEPLARLLRVRMDRVDRQLEQLGRVRFEPADENLEAAAEAAAVRRARQAPSPPSSRRRLRWSDDRRRSPAVRGSALRQAVPSGEPTS